MPGYTKCQNDIFDYLMPRLSANGFKVFYCIWRKTYGWGKTEDYISVSQIMDATGIVSNNTVNNAVKEISKFIDVELGRGRSNRHKFDISRLLKDAESVYFDEGNGTEIVPNNLKNGSKIEPFNGVKDAEIEPFNGVKDAEIEPFNGVKDAEIEPFNGVKDAVFDVKDAVFDVKDAEIAHTKETNTKDTKTKEKKEEESRAKKVDPAQLSPGPVTSSLLGICCQDYDFVINDQKLNAALKNTLKLLRNKNITPAQLTEFESWRVAHHWSRGSPPTLAQVGEFWGQFETWIKAGKPAPTANGKGNGNGLSSQQSQDNADRNRIVKLADLKAGRSYWWDNVLKCEVPGPAG